MISRRKVLEGGAFTTLLAVLPFSRAYRAQAATPSTFDYYISPNGDDNNAGTLSNPWSITALNNNQDMYAGKSIGLLPGTYQYGTKGGSQTALYSMYQNLRNGGSASDVCLNIQGGPSASQPTYLASCNSSGNYAPRTAIIDCSQPGSGTTLPTTEGAVLGQVYGYPPPAVTSYGNLVIDGLVIRNFTYAAILLSGNGTNNYYINNSIIRNCELHNGQNVVSNNNPGAIFVQWANNLLVTNCCMHDLKTNTPGSSFNYMHYGYIQFHSFGTEITNCTTYNCLAVSNKDSWQSMNVSYCYLGFGASSGAYDRKTYTNIGDAVDNYLTASGSTVSFHHNIVCGPLGAWGESQQMNEGTVLVYNNTFFKYGSVGGSNTGLVSFNDQKAGALSGGGGTFQFYNNLIWAADGNYDHGNYSAGAFNKMGAKTGGTWSSLTDCNYNAFGSNGNGMNWGQDYATGNAGWSFSVWRGLGYDANSVLLSSSPFSGTPSEPNYMSFSLSPSSPAHTAGIGGTICGAVDGSRAIGCDFVGSSQPSSPSPTQPNAPVLSITPSP